MFSLYSKHKLYDFSSKIIQVFTSRNIRKHSKNANKGIQNRLAILKEETPEFHKLNINEEAIENMESDFMNTKDAIEFHKRELNKLNSKINLKIIERKYFEKKKYPNMLTWSEKEQIRLLHLTDPEMWSVEKLSQSFPAVPNVIKKILKSQWKIDPLKIKKHDTVVAKNWELLKKGRLNLDKHLTEYLLTFSSRDKLMVQSVQFSTDNYEDKKVIENDSLAVGEFSNIITSQKRNAINNDHIKDENLIKLVSRKKIYRNKKESLYSLEELRQKVKNSSDKPFTPLTAYDEEFLNNKNIPMTLYTENIETNKLERESVKNKYTVQEVEIDPVLQGAGYSVKIKIPDEKRKKGVLYKMKDCYYDDKGNFLYRVPGMESE